MASRTTTDPIEILLEMGVDLDNLSEEEDYLSALKEAIATIQFQTKGAGDERSTILQQEVVKVRKQRKAADPKFKARKTKISANSFRRGTASPGEVRQNVRTGVIDPSKLKFDSVEVAPKPKALPTSAIVSYQAPEAEQEEGKKKKKKKEEPRNILAAIAESVTSIADILKDQYNLKKREGEFDRKKAQRDKRKLDKENLKKGFGSILTGFAKITKPVGGFFDTIFNFLKNILIGKFLVKLIEWFSNPQNQKKVQNIIQFLGKHWKKLLSLYLVFGTGLGRFVFGLTKVLITGAIKLGAAIAKLLAVKGLKRFAGVARFLGGPKGRLIATGAATALTVGGTMMGLGSLGFSGGGEVPGYANGGTVEPSPKKEDGPLDFLSNMSGAAKGAALGSVFGPLGMLAGAGIGSLFDRKKKNEKKITLAQPAEVELEIPTSEEESGGQVDGPGGTDKVPAMLTAGEFVMSRGAVQKFGVKTLESMNAAGGGTNQPKVINNEVYAQGGGMIGAEKGYPSPDKMLTPVEKNGAGLGAPPSSSNFGYRLGQINPETFVTSITRLVEETVEKTDRRRGQGGRPLGDTTRRGGEGFRYTESADGFTTTQFDRKVGGGYFYQDKATLTEINAAIGKPDLIEHQDQILKQLPKGTTIQDVMSGAAIPGVTSEQLARILATSDAQKATNLKEKRARRLDEAIRGIDPNDPTAGYSMSAGDMTPALQQAEATANKRHAELMKSTNPEKIAAYDKQHGQGAYSQKLKEKLYRTYGAGASEQTQPTAPTPTGKVVGRENLSPQAQAAIARLEAKKGLPPDMQYTRNGKKISADDFNRTKNMVGAAKEGGAKGVLDHMMSGVKNMFGGMFGGLQGAVNDPKSFVESMGGTVRDGNNLPPTAEEQRYIDEHNAGMAKIDAKNKARDEERSKASAKQAEHDRLFGEYKKIVMNEDHPLHRKVAGDLFTDDEGMKFEDFKKFKAQQAQAKVKPPAKVAPTAPKVSPPQPPTQPSVNFLPIPQTSGGEDTPPSPRGGSRTPDIDAGNGSASKRKILGIF